MRRHGEVPRDQAETRARIRKMWLEYATEILPPPSDSEDATGSTQAALCADAALDSAEAWNRDPEPADDERREALRRFEAVWPEFAEVLPSDGGASQPESQAPAGIGRPWRRRISAWRGVATISGLLIVVLAVCVASEPANRQPLVKGLRRVRAIIVTRPSAAIRYGAHSPRQRELVTISPALRVRRIEQKHTASGKTSARAPVGREIERPAPVEALSRSLAAPSSTRVPESPLAAPGRATSAVNLPVRETIARETIAPPEPAVPPMARPLSNRLDRSADAARRATARPDAVPAAPPVTTELPDCCSRVEAP